MFYAMETQCVLFEEVTEVSRITYRNSSLTTNRFPKPLYQFTTLGHSNIFVLLLLEGRADQACESSNSVTPKIKSSLASTLFSRFVYSSHSSD